MKYIIYCFLVLFSISLGNSFVYAESKRTPLPGKLLYADIVKVENNYKLSRISNSSLLINLNDLTPTVDTAEHDCGVYAGNGRPVSGNSRSCPPESLFRITKTDKTKTAAFTVLMFGMSAILGNHVRYSYFDMELFKAATDQVIPEHDRTRYVNMYNELSVYNNSLKAKTNEIESFKKIKVKELKDKYIIPYKQKKNNAKYILSVNDKSGFYDNSISHSQLLRLYENSFDSFDFTEQPNIELVINTTPESFDKIISETKTNIENLTNTYISNVPQELENYEKYLVKRSSLLFVNRLVESRINDYRIDLNVPETILVEDKNEIQVPIKLTILSKNFNNIYPRDRFDDKNISLHFDGKKIIITNKTSYFVQIKTISAYYNNNIDNQIYDLELPPKSYKEIFFSPSSIAGQSYYQDINAQLAKSKNVSFGFAVKYRLVEMNTDKTLFKINKYNVYSLLREQYKQSN